VREIKKLKPPEKLKLTKREKDRTEKTSCKKAKKGRDEKVGGGGPPRIKLLHGRRGDDSTQPSTHTSGREEWKGGGFCRMDSQDHCQEKICQAARVLQHKLWDGDVREGGTEQPELKAERGLGKRNLTGKLEMGALSTSFSKQESKRLPSNRWTPH